MCALSHHIREKAHWWKKVKDQVVVEKWREDLLRREEEIDSKETRILRKLTPAMVRFKTFEPLTRPHSDI